MLGYPWNVAYSALLVNMICNLNGINLSPGELIISTCDQHIYKNHVDVAKQLLDRKPYQFPKLLVKRKVDRIEDFTVDDFELVDYSPHPHIKGKVAV